MRAVIIAIAISVAFVAPALAQDAASGRAPQPSSARRSSTLGWVRLPGAESCPSSRELARAIEERLHRSVFVSASEAELAIEGRVERIVDPPMFRATVRIADVDGAVLGERTIDQPGDDCARLLAPLALVIALTIDPDAMHTPDDPDPEVDPDPAEPSVVTERIVEIVEVPGPRWRLEIGLGPSVSVGLLPFVAPGGRASFFLTPPGFVPLMIHGMIFPWSRAELDGGAWVDQLAAYAGIGICPLALRDGGVGFLACAAVDVGAGAVIGQSGGLSLPERERVLGQLDIEARLHVRLVGPLMFFASASFLVPFRGEPYVVGNPPPLVYHRPEPIAGMLEVGVGVDLDL